MPETPPAEPFFEPRPIHIPGLGNIYLCRKCKSLTYSREGHRQWHGTVDSSVPPTPPPPSSTETSYVETPFIGAELPT